MTTSFCKVLSAGSKALHEKIGRDQVAKKTTKQTEYVFPSACCKNRKSRKISIGGWLVRFECRCGNVFKDKSLH